MSAARPIRGLARRAIRRWRGALRSRVPVVIGALLALVVGVLAYLHPGLPEARVDLHAGGVWVTNEESGLVAHLNYPARTLEHGLQVDADRFDITQAEDEVVFSSASSGSIAAIDPGTAALGAVATPGFAFQTVQGAEQLGVIDPESGLVWAMPAADAGALPLVPETAMQTSLPGGRLAAGLDGTVYGVSPQAQLLLRIRPQGQGYETETHELRDLTAGAEVDFTVVGDTPIVLDRSSGSLLIPGLAPVPLPSAEALLQQPGPEADSVLLADATTLYRIELSSGQVQSMTTAQTQSPGEPAVPAVVGSCAYGAWGGSGAYLRWCADESLTQSMTVDSLKGAASPVFRVNREVIVLNDTGDGTVWLPDDEMVLVTDWDEIDADESRDQTQEDSVQSNDEVADPDREAENRPPDAKDDEFGVRPGASTLLPVHMNDSDPDGDLLTGAVSEPPQGMAVSPARGGAALQIEVPEGASGSHGFVYQAADGRGGTDTATVTATVRPWSENEAPVQQREPTTVVASGSTVRYNVMPDWFDPDGDLFYLQSAKAPDGVQVQFRQEGTLIIRDLGSSPGVVPITVELSDGRDARTGVVHLDVRPNAQNIEPLANGDFVVVRQGESTTISPLDNDVDPNGDRLSLVSVSAAPPGVSVTPKLDSGGFEFVASAKGSYYFSYAVTDGPNSSTGVVRVDVLPRETDSSPVVQNDLALLPGGGASLSAVLNNDFDPGGGVLVVQSIEVPDDAPVRVSLIDHHLLRITSQRPFREPLDIGYTVSNGSRSASAKVRVLPVVQEDASQPPEPQPDRLRVRAGDVGSVQVLQNDRSVNGLPLSLSPRLVDDADGLAFVTGDRVRFRAGPEPGTHRLTYNVEDEAGNFASSTVEVEVIADDGQANSAPLPEDLSAWAVAGEEVRIPVPMDGIDPDGDSVTLAGLKLAPEKGVVSVGPSWLSYTPSADASGTDVFSYLVEDRYGAQSTARVRVGIAPPSSVNQPPAAVEDTALVRPDRTVSVDVLANDSDPDGDALSLVPGSLAVAEGGSPSVEQRDDLIAVRTPPEGGATTVSSRVQDGRGGEAQGLLTVTASPDAPLRPPEPNDDVVDQSDADAAEGGRVRVPVLANDLDPDGDRSELEVLSDEPGVSVEGEQLVVPVQDTRRVVVYGVRDVDGQIGYATVSVPGASVERPRVDAQAVPLELRAGQELTLELEDVLVVRPGRAPQLADAERVIASSGLSVAEAEPGDRSLRVTAAPDASGNAAVSFEVADGDPEADRSTLTATVSVPVRIVSDRNRPPVFTPSPIAVAAGEEAVVANVCAMVEDPDGTPAESMGYRLGRLPEKISASLSGCELSVSLTERHPYGELGAIEVSVDDGSGEVSGALPVTVQASTRPLIQASDPAITTARPGRTEQIELKKYVINPFPDQPFEIVGSPQIERGKGTVNVQGTTMEVTPAEDMLGTLAVSYVLGDATGDPSRHVTATARLTVRDKPAPPTDVSAAVAGPGTVVVSFTPGANNGAPITSFRVVSSSGVTAECPATECPVTGLQNGVTHEFQVVAVNEVGPSDPSAWSAPVLTDVQPEQPSPPTLKPMDGAVEASFPPGVSQGSPITEYVVTLHPGGEQQKIPANGELRAVFSGLKNGEAYRASLQAFNSSGKPSSSSALSGEAVPFGKPSPVSSPSLAQVSAGNGSAQLRASWSYGDGNGRPLAGAEVRVSDGRTLQVPYPSEELVFDAPLGTPVSVSVAAFTEAAGPSSPVSSNELRPLDAPAPPTAPTVSMAGHGRVSVTGVQARDGGGYRAGELRLEVLDPASGSWVPYRNGMELGGFTAGRAATVTARAVGDSPTGSRTSPEVSGTSSEPFYEVPGALQAEGAVHGADAVFTVNPAPAARGRPIARVELRENGAVSTMQGNQAVRSGQPGQVFRLEFRACDDLGRCADSWTPVELRLPPGPEFQLRPCDPAAPDCRQVTIVYRDQANPGRNVTCVYRDPAGREHRAEGQEGRPIDTPWRTAITDPARFASEVREGRVQISCG